MKYYELWITLVNWKGEFTVKEFRRVFISPDPNKVLHDMTRKGFLENTGWGKYRVVGPGRLFKKKTNILKSYKMVNEAKMTYAFTEKDSVFIWTRGGYQVGRFACFYPIHIKIRRADLGKWKSFFKPRGKMFHVFGKPVEKTFFGIFYVLYPENTFRAERVDSFSVIPLRETVEFCRKNIYTYEPALEMLNKMYALGLKIEYKESATNM